MKQIAAVVAMVAALAGCSTAPPISQPAPEQPSSGATGSSGITAAFYGDSYTLGTGASDYEKRWSTAICAARGWGEFNPSVNGLGFINNRGSSRDIPREIIAQKPDILFITMGLNDNFSYQPGDTRIESQISTDLERFNTELPETRIIVVEPFWYTDERPESVEIIIGWVKNAAAEIDAEYIPGASRWIEGHPEWMASDGLHPNDAGYAEMAKRMEEELVKLDLPPVG